MSECIGEGCTHPSHKKDLLKREAELKGALALLNGEPQVNIPVETIEAPTLNRKQRRALIYCSKGKE